MSHRDPDILQSFLFKNAPIKGLYVTLDKAFTEILACHQTEGCAAQLLGETLLATCCLLHPLKVKGQLSVQFQSHENIKMLVAKASTEGDLRGIIDCESMPEEPVLGAGHLVVTLQRDETVQSTQSVVAIAQGQTIAQTLTRFFAQSEQLPSLFLFAVSEYKATAMMLQRLPDSEECPLSREQAKELWNEVSHLFYTLKQEELLELPCTEILHRLFHEHDVVTFEPKPLRFHCACSPEKMSRAILTLEQEEAMRLFDEQSAVEVTCEYCKSSYKYSKEEVSLLFEGKGESHH